MRIGQVVLGICAVAAVLWLAPVATADAAIAGRVTDTSAQPLEGIEVCTGTNGPFGTEACAITDGNGEYAIASAGAGSLVHFYSRENRAPGYAPQWYPGKPFFQEAEGVAPADVSHVDAVMSPGGTVTGTVVSSEGGAPIEAVEICPNPVVFREREVTWCTHTDASGKYALRGLSTAEYRFQLYTSGDVNYVGQVTPPRSVVAGTESTLEVQMAPGVKVEGTLTQAGTGLPVEALSFPPYSAPNICALDAATEQRIKCTWIESGGRYKLPGLPPGERFVISFAVDTVEEGFAHPDGYVRQYWNHVPTWGEATPLNGAGGSTIAGVDAALTRGAEVFPHCEVWSPACIPPDGPGERPHPLQEGTPRAHAPLPIHCKKGFRKVTRAGHARCVKVHKRKHHRRRHHKQARRPS